MSNKEDGASLPPIARYKHFKGIYLEETKEYFLCDFYEIQDAECNPIYRVHADLRGQILLVDFTPEGNGHWKRIAGNISAALEQKLIYYIIAACLQK